jgi:hypothetical protein
MSKSIGNQAPGAAVKRSCDADTAIMLGKTGNTIVNQAPGAAVKRSCDADTTIMLGKTGNTIVNQAPGAAVKRSRVIGQSEYPDFVFTSLSNAIRQWEETGTSKARDLSFNIIATVQKWSIPRQSQGVNSSNIFAQETNMWFKGSDLHVTATFWSNEQDRRISASFFFDHSKVPKPISVGEKVRLIGTRLQTWKGDQQLTGKNIRFGHSLVSMSLSNAIEAWKFVTRTQPLTRKHNSGFQGHFPKLALMVFVKKWGIAKKMEGAQLLMIA